MGASLLLHVICVFYTPPTPRTELQDCSGELKPGPLTDTSGHSQILATSPTTSPQAAGKNPPICGTFLLPFTTGGQAAADLPALTAVIIAAYRFLTS